MQTDLNAVAHSLVQSYDWQNGGWGSAPKFPQPMLIEFLLRRHLAGDPQALAPVLHALHAMRRGGMYDVVGGGFARYSTDAAWRIPHFEKMLYDNAQLAGVYLHAWQVTGEPAFRQVVEESLGFVTRELSSPEGGFYSSLDADSEGEEGKFYTWEQAELRAVLGKQAEFFESAYGITAAGNWEGRIVLQRQLDDAGLAAQFSLTHAQVQKTTGGMPRPACWQKRLEPGAPRHGRQGADRLEWADAGGFRRGGRRLRGPGPADARRPQRRFPADRPVPGRLAAARLAGRAGRARKSSWRITPRSSWACWRSTRPISTRAGSSRPKPGRANAGALQRPAGRVLRYAGGRADRAGAPQGPAG